jgi:UDP-N-acetylglucosamine transferase subunit ALG13
VTGMTHNETAAGPVKLRLVVSVGTDVHPFDRLIGWVDRWLDEQCHVEAIIQYGRSVAPRNGSGHAFLDHSELHAALERADVVVSHGGPSTITESRRFGVVPIVVPRSAHHGEHVDDHQRLFTARLADTDLILRVETEEEFRHHLDAAIREPSVHRMVTGTAVAIDGARVDAVRRFAELAQAVATGGRPPPGERPRVVYIAGFPRSGTTLLERMLGTVPAVTALGEVVHLWERGLIGNERCGCGKHFHECPMWRAIGTAAFGGWDQVDREEVLRYRHAADRTRCLPALTVPLVDRLLKGNAGRSARGYSRYLRPLYRAARSVTDAEVLVDSSKHASYAAVLRSAAVDLRMVYVTRDSRGVAYSWSKAVLKPEVTDGHELMPQWGPVRTAWMWLVNGLLFHVLSATGTPTLRLRYEDVLADPRSAVARVLNFADVTADATSLSRITSTSAYLGSDHTVAGNPMRFTSGSVALRQDHAWRSAMASRDRRIVSVITWPLRVLYGYTGRR